jgi:hypothetical protein
MTPWFELDAIGYDETRRGGPRGMNECLLSIARSARVEF